MPRFEAERAPGPKREVSTEVGTSTKVFGVTETRVTNARIAAEEARARVNKNRTASMRGHKRDFAAAQAHLGRMHPSSVVEFLLEQPMGILELYLLAEETGQARESILRSFPKPGIRARMRYLPEKRTRSVRNPAQPPVAVGA